MNITRYQLVLTNSYISKYGGIFINNNIIILSAINLIFLLIDTKVKMIRYIL